jgi:hypothetical protein
MFGPVDPTDMGGSNTASGRKKRKRATQEAALLEPFRYRSQHLDAVHVDGISAHRTGDGNVVAFVASQFSWVVDG